MHTIPHGKLPSELPDCRQSFGILKMQWEIVERFLARLVAANQKDPLQILLPKDGDPAFVVLYVSRQLFVSSPCR